MENYSYHVPFYVLTNGVATQGFTSDLAGGQLGLFDRQNFAVATGIGQGKELFFAQGALGSKGFNNEPVTESHKSPFFFVKDIMEDGIYVSLPAKIQNEEWILGYDGSQSSKSLEYIKGKPTRIKLYFHGEPVYRMFNGPKEYLISYTPTEDCTDDCATDCGGDRQDPKPHAIKQINMINKHPELKKLGVTAKLVDSTYSAATATRKVYTLTVMDDGTGVALAKLQGKYPTVKIKKLSRSGIVSVYQFDQPIADSAPGNFQYEGSQISLQVCGNCPAGWTSVGGYDTYFIKRPLAGSEDLTTDSSRDTYANSVGGEYATALSITLTDANKTFSGNTSASATVQIVVPSGTNVVALKADIVDKVGSVPAYCQAPAGATVAWVAGNTCVSGSRTLKIKLNRNECDLASDRHTEVINILKGVKGVVVDGSSLPVVTVITGDSCVDEYTVVQNSDDCLDEACLTSNQTFTFDTPLPIIDGKAWEVLDPSITADPTRKVGIRISAGYFDPKFGNCSFDPYDYYEQMPIKMEVSLLKEDLTGCAYANLATRNKVKNARIARQSGEYVVREVLMKTEAYLKHVKQWDNDVRTREAFDMQLLNTVDRNAYYKLWYISFYASYNKTSRTGTKEKFTTVVAVKESDPNEAAFITNIINVLSSKSGVVPHVNS